MTRITLCLTLLLAACATTPRAPTLLPPGIPWELYTTAAGVEYECPLSERCAKDPNDPWCEDAENRLKEEDCLSAKQPGQALSHHLPRAGGGDWHLYNGGIRCAFRKDCDRADRAVSDEFCVDYDGCEPAPKRPKRKPVSKTRSKLIPTL
jgi:hypothetical protein